MSHTEPNRVGVIALTGVREHLFTCIVHEAQNSAVGDHPRQCLQCGAMICEVCYTALVEMVGDIKCLNCQGKSFSSLDKEH